MVTTCIKVKNCTTWNQVPISCIIKYKGAKHACYVRNQVITIQHEIFLNLLWLVHPCVPISCTLNAQLTTHLYYFFIKQESTLYFLNLYLSIGNHFQISCLCPLFLNLYYFISCYLWDKSWVMSCSGITWFDSRVDPPRRWVTSLFLNHWLRFLPAPSTYWICSWVCLIPQTKPNFLIVRINTTSFTLQTLVIWPKYLVLHK